MFGFYDAVDDLVFMLPEGERYSRRFVRLSGTLSGK